MWHNAYSVVSYDSVPSDLGTTMDAQVLVALFRYNQTSETFVQCQRIPHFVESVSSLHLREISFAKCFTQYDLL